MAVTEIDRTGSLAFEVNEVIKLTPLNYDLENLLPHRGDCLLISRIRHFDFEAGVIITQYDVPNRPWWIDGHFPGMPIMPGFLIAEHGAQSGATFVGLNGIVGLPYLARADRLKFEAVVRPGDTLYTKVQIVKWDGKIDKRIWRFNFLVKNQFSKNVATGLIIGVVRRI